MIWNEEPTWESTYVKTKITVEMIPLWKWKPLPQSWALMQQYNHASGDQFIGLQLDAQMIEL